MPLIAFDVCILGLASGSTIGFRETQTGRNELRKLFISDLSRPGHWWLGGYFLPLLIREGLTFSVVSRTRRL
jgi:hypothetical protein